MRPGVESAFLLSLLAIGMVACGFFEANDQRALAVAPDHIDFGRTTVGETAHGFVIVTNLGVVPLAVERIRAAAPFEPMEASFTLEPGESRPVAVDFSPAQAGRAEATLEFQSGDGTATVSLLGEADGVPAIHVDPPSVEFGEVAVGEISTALITIENRGEGPLRALDAELVGNYAIRIRFSDGHDTGLYSWEYLRRIDPGGGPPPRPDAGPGE